MNDDPRTARNGDNPEPDAWEPVDLAALEDRARPQPTIGGFGLLYPGERHVFTGPPESAKTLAAYAIALEVIRAGGIVSIIDFEMGRYQACARLREMGCTTEELHCIVYVDPTEGATPSRIQRLVQLRPSLVIIDAAAGAYSIQGFDDNSRMDVERFTNLYCDPFKDAGIATAVLDHVVKNAENRQGWGIGSERKKGVADIHFEFGVIQPISRGGHGAYKVICWKDRYGWHPRGKIAEIHFTSDAITHQISWEWQKTEPHESGEPFRPTHLMEKVSQFLQTLSEPVSRNTIVKSVEGTAQYVAYAIDRLVEEGYAEQSEGERRAKLVAHKSLFTGQNPPLRTSSALLREEVKPLLRVTTVTEEVDAENEEVTSSAAEEVDVYAADTQHLLDDKDIPW